MRQKDFLSLLPFRRNIRIIAMLILAVNFNTHDSTGQTTHPEIQDPVLIKEGDRYYVFGTGPGISIHTSEDMENWETAGPAFESRPDWMNVFLPDFSGNVLKSPAIHFRDGTYYLYYSASTTGSNNSVIGVATNPTLDRDSDNYRWTDRGRVVNSVAGRDLWNAVAPQVVEDPDGAFWLCFGSYWGGLKLAKMDETLLRVSQSSAEREWHSIAGRHRYEKLNERDGGDATNPNLDFESLYPREVVELNRASENGAIAAPFILSRDETYYLFATWGSYTDGNQKIVVGRSDSFTGPYYDKEGERMDWGGGSNVVNGLSGSSEWKSAGRGTVFTERNTDYLVFHSHADTDASHLMIQTIEWDPYGWPSVNLPVGD